MKVKIMLGGSPIELEITTEKTWNDVLNTCKTQKINIPNAHIAKIGETRSLLIKDSILPTSTQENMFHVFVTPVESNGGVEELPYKIVKTLIKRAFKIPGAKAHFGNYTQMSTAKMNELWRIWESEDVSNLEIKNTEANKKAKQLLKESISLVKNTEKTTQIVESPTLLNKIDTAIILLQEVKEELNRSIVFPNVYED